MCSAGMMCSSRNAFTRSPSSTAFALGGGWTGIAILVSSKCLVRYSSFLVKHDLFRKPVSIPDRGRGHAFRDHALARADHAAHAGERGQMIVGVAEHRIDHGDALEVVADLVLHRHADAAVELNRGLADDPG